MGARWYDPAIGRWLSPDTFVPDPANPQDLNRYSYTRNNPLKHVDPSGHYTCYTSQPNMANTLTQSPQCTAWVETALTTLGTAGQLGVDLVDFLRSHDGISIIFSVTEPYFSAPGSAIKISMDLLSKNLGSKEGLGYVSAFGHEIEHQRNGDGGSIRGEMKAYEVERQLRDKLGAENHATADELHRRAPNPYSRADQATAWTILSNSYNYYSSFPASPLPEEALWTAMNVGMFARGVFEAAGDALVNIGKIGAYGLDRLVQSLSVNP